jgi:2-hydroxychromene-2-carboxylate isomerase
MQVQPTFFPVSADLAAKLIVVVDQAQGAMAALDLAGRCGRAVWEQQRNLAEPATLAALLAEAGLPPTWLDRAADPKIAQTLAGYTQQAIDAGVFGAPSYVVDGEIFWGQDRLDFLARRLAPG